MKKILVILFLFIFSLPAFANIKTSDFYIEEINNSIKNYQENLIKNQINKDILFYNLQKKYEKIIFDMNSEDIDNISQLQCNNYKGKYSPTIDNRNNKTDIKKYNAKGIGLYCSEAMSIYIVDYNWLKKHYGKNLSKEYKMWLKYLKKPIPFEEGMLDTDKNTLNKQIKDLERFIHCYPNFIGIQDIKKELNKLKTNNNHQSLE